MSLATQHESVPNEEHGKIIVGRTRGGTYQNLGARARLSWGERLLGEYECFWHIKVSEQTKEWEKEFESNTTTQNFRVKFLIRYSVSDPVSFVKNNSSIESAVVTPFNRTADEEAERFPPGSHRQLQHAIEDAATAVQKKSPYQFNSIEISVRPPKDFESATMTATKEDMTTRIQREKRDRVGLILQDLEGEYEIAVASGNTALAESLGKLKIERQKSNLDKYEFAKMAVKDGLVDESVFRTAAARVVGVDVSGADNQLAKNSDPKRLR